MHIMEVCKGACNQSNGNSFPKIRFKSTHEKRICIRLQQTHSLQVLVRDSLVHLAYLIAICLLGRYVCGEDVYMSPIDVLPLPNNEAAVLLRGDREASAAEIRIYSCVQVK